MNNHQHPLWQSVDITNKKQQRCFRSPTSRTSGEIIGHLLPGTKAHSFDTDLYNQQGECVGVYAESLGLNEAGSGFMRELLSTASSAPIGRSRAAKLIIPRLRGYIVRADIIPLRMAQSPNMIQATSFANPQQWFAGELLTDSDFCQLSNVFRAAAGGVIIDVGGLEHDDVAEALNTFEREIRNRLSFPWILEDRRQTLAFVATIYAIPDTGVQDAITMPSQRPWTLTWWSWMLLVAGLKIHSMQVYKALSFRVTCRGMLRSVIESSRL